MKRHPRRTSRIVMALTALCFVWLLSAQIVSVTAYAEGGTPPYPPSSLPADTTIVTGGVVIPDDGTTTADVIDVVVLLISAVL